MSNPKNSSILALKRQEGKPFKSFLASHIQKFCIQTRVGDYLTCLNRMDHHIERVECTNPSRPFEECPELVEVIIEERKASLSQFP